MPLIVAPPGPITCRSELGIDGGAEQPRGMRERISRGLLVAQHLLEAVQAGDAEAGPALTLRRWSFTARPESFSYGSSRQGGDALLGAGHLEVHVRPRKSSMPLDVG